jgi:hypothetical protein
VPVPVPCNCTVCVPPRYSELSVTVTDPLSDPSATGANDTRMLHDPPAATGVPTAQSPALPLSRLKFVSPPSNAIALIASAALPGFDSVALIVALPPSLTLPKLSGLLSETAGSHLPYVPA